MTLTQEVTSVELRVAVLFRKNLFKCSLQHAVLAGVTEALMSLAELWMKLFGTVELQLLPAEPLKYGRNRRFIWMSWMKTVGRNVCTCIQDYGFYDIFFKPPHTCSISFALVDKSSRPRWLSWWLAPLRRLFLFLATFIHSKQKISWKSVWYIYRYEAFKNIIFRSWDGCQWFKTLAYLMLKSSTFVNGFAI